MRSKTIYAFLLVCLWGILATPFSTTAQTVLSHFDSLSIPLNEGQQRVAVQQQIDSLLQQSWYLKSQVFLKGQEITHLFLNRTWDFYFLLGLVLFLGCIRYFDSEYFYELGQVAIASSTGNKYQQEKIDRSSVSNLIMNIFFTLSLAAYLFFVLKNYVPSLNQQSKSVQLFIFLVGGVTIIYLIKYVVIKLSGWLLNVQEATDHYLFNVFLVNKVMAVLLLPFTILIAFLLPSWSFPIWLLSLGAIFMSFILRYVRSWKVLRASFELSKFHFFTYLCASEILPLAVLGKLILSKLAL